MKRIIAVIMAAAMALSLVSCGKEAAEPEETIPATAEPEEIPPAEESPEPSAEPEETPEPETADPYGLGIAVSDIDWDAVVYDFSGDRMEDGYPSMYQNLAQTVALLYSAWEEYGWHKYINGQSLTFQDVIPSADAASLESWEYFDTMFHAGMYDIFSPRAEAAFQLGDDTKRLLVLLDGLSMEELAEIMAEPVFQAVNDAEARTAHNPKLTAYLATPDADVNAGTVPPGEQTVAEAKVTGFQESPLGDLNPEFVAGLLGISVEEYLAMAEEVDEILNNPAYADATRTESYAAQFNMTAAQYNAVLPVIRQIAADALATGATDLEHVRAASRMLYAYVEAGTYGFEADYDSPYGLIIGGNYSCAGTAAAMCMTLAEMGYTLETSDLAWVGKGQWAHQYAELNLDGQHGWADCMGGIADYGDYPFSCDNPDGTYTDPETGVTYRLGTYM